LPQLTPGVRAYDPFFHIEWLPWAGGATAAKFTVFVPFWIPLVIAAIPTTWMWLRRGSKEGHCTHCGYDLTGNESGVCPECGRSVKCEE